jgi:hypothetical protein
MKNQIFLMIVFCLLISNKQQIVPEKAEYIEFVHDGEVTKYELPLIISKIKIDIQLNDAEKREMKDLQDAGAIKTKEEYIKWHYKLIVTNPETFTLISSFVLNNPEFYTNNVNTNYGSSEDIAVIVNKQTHQIFHKRKDEFLNKIVAYIAANNGDPRLIKALSHYE